jgi:hypothetical protein
MLKFGWGIIGKFIPHFLKNSYTTRLRAAWIAEYLFVTTAAHLEM